MTKNDLDQIGSLMDSKFKEFGVAIKEDITASAQMVMSEVGKFIEDNLFPMLEEKADKTDIERLERKIDRLTDVNLDHEHRIKAIEHVPVVAHALKVTKPRA